MMQASMTNEPLVLMVIVVNRAKGEMLMNTLATKGAQCNLLTLGRGTADKKILSYFGLGEEGKSILYSSMSYDLAEDVLEMLENEHQFKKPGKGIAFCIPINGYADKASRKRLQDLSTKKEAGFMDQTSEHDLIIAITNQGYADEVMDVAKLAGAKGGTVMHARGIGMRDAEKFFGLSIHPEKEILFIVSRKEGAQEIMHAIADQKGLKSDARTITFSLPISSVAGLPFEK